MAINSTAHSLTDIWTSLYSFYDQKKIDGHIRYMNNFFYLPSFGGEIQITFKIQAQMSQHRLFNTMRQTS